MLNGADENTLTGNSASGHGGIGFALSGGASNNTLNGNVANHEGWTGFAISDGASYNHFEANTANGSQTGFWIEGLSGNAPAWNTFAANKAINNIDNGFAVSDGATHTTFTGDIANNNQLLNGFAVYGSATYTTVTHSIARGNGLWDALDEAPQTNTWADDNFGRTSGLG